ncbi:MAG TPA: tetratricopeptide repeat protein [Gammaproteobacteria bacterium]|nr:tetratricopeptide repeat protein [Gammaproteobacteria bacterium]
MILHGCIRQYLSVLRAGALFSTITLLSPNSTLAAELSYDQAEKKLQKISLQIQIKPDDAVLYTERGNLYFMMHDFDSAINDFNRAIELDPFQDKAWYGRGMANGRMGYIDEGIADLSVYIERHPDSSVAFTKRGVRYLWKGDSENAHRDLSRAIALDPNNAEAHDDLGVVLAQRKKYKTAINHFTKTVTIDPSYQKGHHNLAMAYYLSGQDLFALQAVDNALILAPEARNSMLLKSEILKALGRTAEAKALEDEAMFLPEGNWHESAPVK